MGEAVVRAKVLRKLIESWRGSQRAAEQRAEQFARGQGDWASDEAAMRAVAATYEINAAKLEGLLDGEPL